MINLRRLVQLFFFCLFVYLILATVSPLPALIPNNLFFVIDPLLAITTIIASRTFILISISSLIVILLSIFLGRVFCGWVCPLGTILDISRRCQIKPIKKWSLPLWLRRVRYFLLTIIFGSALLGANLAGWFDPISIVHKAFALFFHPNFVYLSPKILHYFEWDQLYYDLIESGILSLQDISFHASILFMIICMIIILLNLIQIRFWCRNLCPLGALLGLFSKGRHLRVHINQDCKQCAKCQKACPMGAITDDFKVYDEECTVCYTCTRACKFNVVSISFKKAPPRYSPESSVLPSRRGFLMALAGGVMAVPLLKYNFGFKKPGATGVLRPPGAERDESVFLAKCVRCGECMKVCPTNGLQPVLFQTGFYGMWSPVLIPRVGECDYECNFCIRVCPSKALAPMSLAEKKQWKIGLARVDLDRCINCLRCEEYCPIPEKAIKIMVKDGLKYPQVIDDLCIGCGVCEKVCSVPGPAAIRVVPLIN